MTQELITIEQDRFLPALSMPQAIARRDALVAFVREIMVPGVDYGRIPGTDKDTLHKPGAERLCSFFGLTPDFQVEKEIEQWDSDEPLFYYRYKCRLIRDGRVVGDGEGSCNSRESKYRWRNADRLCPKCEQPAIKRSKFPPKNNRNAEPGWYCYSKAGGCGAEFAADDPAVTSQRTGRMPNPDIFDLVNTIQKMAQKRAFVAATLIAVNASEYFTQDLEDLPQPAAAYAPEPEQPVTPLRPAEAPANDKQRSYIARLQDDLAWTSEQMTVYANEQEVDLVALTKNQASAFIEGLKKLVEERSAPAKTSGVAQPKPLIGPAQNVEAKFGGRGQLAVRFTLNGQTVLWANAPSELTYLENGDQVVVSGTLGDFKGQQVIRATNIVPDFEPDLWIERAKQAERESATFDQDMPPRNGKMKEEALPL